MMENNYLYENHSKNRIRIDKTDNSLIKIYITNTISQPCIVGDVETEFWQVFLVKINVN